MTLTNSATAPFYPFWPYYGYFDLGPLQIPPLPPVIGLTDTVTRTVSYLYYNANTAVIVLSSTVLAANEKGSVQVYGIGDGPTVPTNKGEAQLTLVNGVLTIKFLPQGNTQSSKQGPPLFIRDINQLTNWFFLTINTVAIPPVIVVNPFIKQTPQPSIP